MVNLKQKIPVYGYAILAIATVLGLAGTYNANKMVEEEARNRINDINSFLRIQCSRDNYRDEIIIDALEDAQRRAIASINDPRLQAVEVARIQASINKLLNQSNCLFILPSKK